MLSVVDTFGEQSKQTSKNGHVPLFPALASALLANHTKGRKPNLDAVIKSTSPHVVSTGLYIATVIEDRGMDGVGKSGFDNINVRGFNHENKFALENILVQAAEKKLQEDHGLQGLIGGKQGPLSQAFSLLVSELDSEDMLSFKVKETAATRRIKKEYESAVDGIMEKIEAVNLDPDVDTEELFGAMERAFDAADSFSNDNPVTQFTTSLLGSGFAAPPRLDEDIYKFLATKEAYEQHVKPQQDAHEVALKETINERLGGVLQNVSEQEGSGIVKSGDNYYIDFETFEEDVLSGLKGHENCKAHTYSPRNDSFAPKSEI